MHWYDRNVPTFHNPFETPAERQEVAGAGDLAFRENADDVAGVECVACVPQGAKDDTWAAV